jgi:hypothetical protein
MISNVTASTRKRALTQLTELTPLFIQIKLTYNPTNAITAMMSDTARSVRLGFIGCLLLHLRLYSGRRFFIFDALRVCAVPTFLSFVVPHFVAASDAILFSCHC